ncbi:MAG: type II toxin-antitoxin system VapC family toxin [Cyanobacteria bacterium]|nr:type II toxin-antitoxin system VapC family toxin [Cyanobacteriota bacterium]
MVVSRKAIAYDDSAKGINQQAADTATETQRQAARQLIESGQPLFLPKTVALELEWVLRGIYGFTAPQVLAVFDVLLGHPSLTLEDRPAVVQAVAGLHHGGLDFAEALHHASCRTCQTFASFDDRRFARRIRQLNLPPRVVVPG